MSKVKIPFRYTGGAKPMGFDAVAVLRTDEKGWIERATKATILKGDEAKLKEVYKLALAAKAEYDAKAKAEKDKADAEAAAEKAQKEAEKQPPAKKEAEGKNK